MLAEPSTDPGNRARAPWRVSTLAWAALALPCAALLGCDASSDEEQCPAIDCEVGPVIDFSSTLGESDLILVMRLGDDEPRTCRVHLTRDSHGDLIGLSDCDQTLQIDVTAAGIRIPGTPETIEFALEQEDGCSLQETWSPEYSVTHHACDITCVNNSLAVDTSDCIVDAGVGGAGGGRL